MPKFGTGTLVSFKKFTVDYYAAADARTEGYHNAVFISLARAELRLTQRRRICVV